MAVDETLSLQYCSSVLVKLSGRWDSLCAIEDAKEDAGTQLWGFARQVCSLGMKGPVDR